MLSIQNTTETTQAWITCARPNPQACVRLFCFPYAGGSASIFRTWSGGLPAEIEVCPVQLPGRGSRLMEPPYTRLSRLVQTLSRVLHPYMDVPFAFFGHSMGALLCFELARQLRRLYGLNPLHLFVSGHRAPQIPDPDPPIHQLPDDEFMEELHCLNGTPEDVLQNALLMQLMLPALRADFEMCEAYMYTIEAPLGCPISAFGGLQDQNILRSDLEAWRDQTSVSFKLRMFPGDHFFLHTSKLLLLETLSEELYRFVIKKEAMTGSARDLLTGKYIGGKNG
jgi:medium-chain acyl-[acyl-carrier-protein] hydrolase